MKQNWPLFLFMRLVQTNSPWYRLSVGTCKKEEIDEMLGKLKRSPENELNTVRFRTCLTMRQVIATSYEYKKMERIFILSILNIC